MQAKAYNKRLDNDIDTLVAGIQDILQVATVGEKGKYVISQEKLQMESRVSSMIRAAESLLTLSSEIKQSLLLNDTNTLATLYATRSQILSVHEKKTRDTLELLQRDLESWIEDLEQARARWSCRVQSVTEENGDFDSMTGMR